MDVETDVSDSEAMSEVDAVESTNSSRAEQGNGQKRQSLRPLRSRPSQQQKSGSTRRRVPRRIPRNKEFTIPPSSK